MDVHVRRAITHELRLRGVDVMTARDDGAAELDDASLLDRASVQSRVLFTQDDDLLREALRDRRAARTSSVLFTATNLTQLSVSALMILS
jgi:predicted nuclease of predicted toxin-antitoxin system